jgi:hypothetical protein
MSCLPGTLAAAQRARSATVSKMQTRQDGANRAPSYSHARPILQHIVNGAPTLMGFDQHPVWQIISSARVPQLRPRLIPKLTSSFLPPALSPSTVKNSGTPTSISFPVREPLVTRSAEVITRRHSKRIDEMRRSIPKHATLRVSNVFIGAIRN